MHRHRLTPLALLAVASVAVQPILAQAPVNPTAVAASGQAAPQLSPDATSTVTLDGKPITVKYSAPSARGRKIMGELVPYGKVWRTGANPATTLITAGHLKIGTLDVPAGTYTLYTLPDARTWMLIVSRQTGQWGTEYKEAQDLGRTPMIGNPLAMAQDRMSISFENRKKNSAELHIKWENTDRYVTVTTVE